MTTPDGPGGAPPPPGSSAAGTVVSAGLGGIAANQPPREQHRVFVGPSTGSELNTLRIAIFPIACWRAEDLNFSFDSSFVEATLAKETKRLKRLIDVHPGSPLSVFGHADPVGRDDYNKALSGRRAQAIYAMLIRKPELWEELFQQGDWKPKHVQSMLGSLGFDPGRTDGQMDERAREAVRAFQRSEGLGPDGQPGPGTRKALYLKYMDLVCRDRKGVPYRLKPDQFLGRGVDRLGKADYQGCGELNPVRVFSRAEQTAFDADPDKTNRNRDNEPNRRVVVLLFRKGAKVTPQLWPCPRATEGLAGCQKRLWSDHQKRRANTERRREFGVDRDVFACRFYDRLSNGDGRPSPCERILESFKIRLFDLLARPLPAAPFEVVRGDIDGDTEPSTDPDTADGNGDITLRDLKVPTVVTVRWSRPQAPADGQAAGEPPPKPPTFEFEMDVFVNIDAEGQVVTGATGPIPDGDEQDPKKREAAAQRLSNLGFTMGETLADNVRFFQRELGLEETGKVRDIDQELKDRHTALDPPSRYKVGSQGIKDEPNGPPLMRSDDGIDDEEDGNP
jgi:outer membrane protein OmpA-like peptidoglycan-associated protein